MREQTELLGEFISENYEFRHNVLSDGYEMRERCADTADFRPLTREALNTISLRAKRIGIGNMSVRSCIEEMIYSEETPDYNPVASFLESLPEWDGQDHIGRLFSRIPGLTDQQRSLMSVWMRSCVAHWTGDDLLHGNECCLTLIGSQGCGKSTFCARLLPERLRRYYLDHINLANKNDKEMALTGNLLVNLDELDQIRPCQQAELKHTLTKSTVNGRPVYARTQVSRRRYASFVSTTNTMRPLLDPTGSRRYLCICIPKDSVIDNCGEIDYGQLYSQILREIRVEHLRYWYTRQEVNSIELQNLKFRKVNDMEAMVTCCFRHPANGEKVTPLYQKEILNRLKEEFPELEMEANVSVRLGLLLKRMGFVRKSMSQGSVYLMADRRISPVRMSHITAEAV